MNKILQQIKEDLKTAMKVEVQIRKEGPANGDFIASQISKLENAVAHKTVSRAIISMIPDLGKKPDETTVDDMYKLLKKYAKSEKERAVYQFGHLKEADVEGKTPSQVKKLVSDTITALGDSLDNLLITIAESYLPIGVSEEDIRKFIDEKIDLTQFKNKMQAMGPIMKHFPSADGNFVRTILQSI